MRHKVPVPAEIDCLNCGSQVSGSYCQVCGQPVDTARYSVTGLGKEFLEQFRKLDVAGIFITFGQLIQRPGMFVRAYLAGKRVGYLTPIKYFFYSFILQASAALIIHKITGDDTSILTERSDFSSQIIDLIATVFWGLGWWALYRRSGLNVVENIVAAIYFTAQGFMFTLLIRLASVPFAGKYPEAMTVFNIVDTSVSVIYSYFFAWRLFRDIGWKVFAKQTLLSVSYILVVLILFMLARYAQAAQSAYDASPP